MTHRAALHPVADTTLLADGLGFPEGPRWRDGRLWFSDFRTKKIMTLDLAGNLETVATVPGQPSGLGWLPDGTLLAVSMLDRRVMRLREGRLERHADLSALASFHCNDMVVDLKGNAYVGNFGFALYEEDFKPAEVILVTPEGDARVVADQMAFPNGNVVTPDGRTLIVAETFAARLTAFDLEHDGSLSHRRVWAAFDDLGVRDPGGEEVKRVAPDGICLDEEGAVWVASPGSDMGLFRVREGGKVTHRFEPKSRPFACMLGGPDLRTLFVLTARLQGYRQIGCIETMRVEVPGAGLP